MLSPHDEDPSTTLVEPPLLVGTEPGPTITSSHFDVLQQTTVSNAHVSKKLPLLKTTVSPIVAMVGMNDTSTHTEGTTPIATTTTAMLPRSICSATRPLLHHPETVAESHPDLTDWMSSKLLRLYKMPDHLSPA